MSTPDTSCASCGAHRSDNTHLCADCNTELATLLGDIRALVFELDITLSKQRRFEQQTSSSRTAEQALPYDISASNMLHELHAALSVIVERCIKQHVRSVDYRNSTPGKSSQSMSSWLLWRVDGIAAHPWAAETLHTLQRINDRALLVIDRPPERTFAGPCDECGRDLYASAGRATVECRACGLTYDLTARREWLLHAVDDQLATATEIARALTSLDMPVTSERIWQWRHRERIEQRGTDRRQRPLYRVGDVVTLLIEHAGQRSA